MKRHLTDGTRLGTATVAICAAASLLLGCGDGSDRADTTLESEPTTTTAGEAQDTEQDAPVASDTTADVEPPVTDYTTLAAEFDAELTDMWSNILSEFDTYVAGATNTAEQIDVESVWSMHVSATLGDTLGSLPDPGTPPPTNWEATLDSLEMWRAGHDAAVLSFQERRDALATAWDPVAGNPEFNEIIEGLIVARQSFESQCISLAEELVDTGIALNCTGTPGGDTPAEASDGWVALGNLELRVEAPFVAVQNEPGTVEITSEENPEFYFAVSANPVFAVPGEVSQLAVREGTDWPDDVEAWLSELGGTVHATGETKWGDFDVDWWDVSISEADAVALTGGDPAIAVVGLAGNDHPFVLQIIDGWIARIHRVHIDPTSSILGFSQAQNTIRYPGAEDSPYLGSPEEVEEWIEAALPTFLLR